MLTNTLLSVTGILIKNNVTSRMFVDKPGCLYNINKHCLKKDRCQYYYLIDFTQEYAF